MPSANSHLIGGLLGFGLLFWLSGKYNFFTDFTLSSWGVVFLLHGIFSLLPDVDKGDSKIHNSVSTELLLIVIFTGAYYLWSKDIRAVLVAAGSLLILLSLNFLKHRGFIHTPLAGVLMALPVFYWNPYYGIWATIGYLNHLLLDKIF